MKKIVVIGIMIICFLFSSYLLYQKKTNTIDSDLVNIVESYAKNITIAEINNDKTAITNEIEKFNQFVDDKILTGSNEDYIVCMKNLNKLYDTSFIESILNTIKDSTDKRLAELELMKLQNDGITIIDKGNISEIKRYNSLFDTKIYDIKNKYQNN